MRIEFRRPLYVNTAPLNIPWGNANVIPRVGEHIYTESRVYKVEEVRYFPTDSNITVQVVVGDMGEINPKVL